MGTVTEFDGTRNEADEASGRALDDAGLCKGSKRAVLLDVTHTLGADVDEDRRAELRNEDVPLVEVRLTADLAGRVELGSTGTV